MQDRATAADTVVAILAGGRSRRMGGRHKATLPMAGGTVLGCILQGTGALGLPCWLVGAHESCPEDPDLIAALSATGLPMTRDRRPDAGPLAGLDAAFAATSAQRILLLACDLPFVTAGFLSWLVAQADDAGAIPVDASGRLQPLCAVYGASCRAHLTTALDAGSLRLQEFAGRTGARLLAHETWARFDPSGKLLMNLNDPADYAEARQWLDPSDRVVRSCRGPSG